MAETYALTLLSSSLPIRAVASFPPDFAAFDGHFPGEPILPGFMHIQLALDILRAAGLPHDLKEVPAARFRAPILPGDPITAELTQAESGAYEVKLSGADKVYSTFKLVVG